MNEGLKTPEVTGTWPEDAARQRQGPLAHVQQQIRPLLLGRGLVVRAFFTLGFYGLVAVYCVSTAPHMAHGRICMRCL